MVSCRDCGGRKYKPERVVPPLRTLEIGAFNDRWAMDHCEPLWTTTRGNRYVLVLTEYLTRYVVAVAAPDRQASTVARVLVTEVLTKFGAVRELLSDGTKEYRGRVINELVMMMQGRQVHPGPYRPQMNGLMEHFNDDDELNAPIRGDSTGGERRNQLSCYLLKMRG